MIRKAADRDIDAAEHGYTELLTYEKENGSHSNWVLGYTPQEVCLKKAAGRELCM